MPGRIGIEGAGAYLSGSSLGVLFLDLDLTHIAGMLNDFRDEGLMSPTDFSQNSLYKIDSPTITPVLVEIANRVAKRWAVRLDHAEGSMDRPENEEDNEKMMSIPEPLEVRPSEPLKRRSHHGSQREEHDIPGPARTRLDIGQQKALKAKAILRRELAVVVPMSERVEPAEEENRPGDEFVEGDVLVELNDAVQGRLSAERDQRAADREEDQGDVEVEYKRCCSRDGVGDAKGCACRRKVIFEVVIHEAKSEHHGVHSAENENSTAGSPSAPRLSSIEQHRVSYNLRYPSLTILQERISDQFYPLRKQSTKLGTIPNIEFLSPGQIPRRFPTHLARHEHARERRPSRPFRRRRRVDAGLLVWIVGHCNKQVAVGSIRNVGSK